MRERERERENRPRRIVSSCAFHMQQQVIFFSKNACIVPVFSLVVSVPTRPTSKMYRTQKQQTSDEHVLACARRSWEKGVMLESGMSKLKPAGKQNKSACYTSQLKPGCRIATEDRDRQESFTILVMWNGKHQYTTYREKYVRFSSVFCEVSLLIQAHLAWHRPNLFMLKNAVKPQLAPHLLSLCLNHLQFLL